MGSRLKQDPDKIFDVFIEFVREAGNGDELGRVVKFYPKDFSDAEVLKPSVKFAFPYSHGLSKFGEEHYTFVMTDINSKFKFGFCKLVCSGGTERNYCIISCLPWFDSFFTLLDDVSSRLSKQDHEGALGILSRLHESKPSEASQIICTSPTTSDEKVTFVCPNITSLPSIPHNKNFSELFRSFRTANLMKLFASMLFERRILMFGSSIERLTSCIHGLNQLIYPMYWQHLFIPILPPSLIDYCSAPMPYVIGLHTSTMMRLHQMEYSDAVLVNLDENKIHTEHADLAAIPRDVIVMLKKQLKLQKALMEKNTAIGEGVSRAFLASMVSLIGGYRNAMRFHDGADITFDPDIFVAGLSFSRDPSSHMEYRRFFEMVLHMQSFQQFINDRLDIMNAGKGFQDEFDKAVISISGDEDRWKTQSRYKDWLSHMKKQGKLLKREGRDKWTVFASKVKSKSKKTWKEIKSKLEDTRKEESFSQHNRPSVHCIPDYDKKPPRPQAPPVVPKDLRTTAMLRSGMLRRSSLERTQRYHLLDVDTKAALGNQNDDSDDALNHLKRVDTNLSNDPDLLSWMARPLKYEILSDSSLMKKSFSVEGLCNARDNEDAIFYQSALDTSICSTGKDLLLSTRSYSSANVMPKRLESLDVSSMDSSFADVPLREESIDEKGNELFCNTQHTSMSTSYSFRDASSNDLNCQKHNELGFLKLNKEDCVDWSREDLMDFESSNSSIEFDPLKVHNSSLDNQRPIPFPRNKSKKANVSREDIVVNDQSRADNIFNRSSIPPPVPLPRRRDATTVLNHHHHRKQTLNLDAGPQTKQEEHQHVTDTRSPQIVERRNADLDQGAGTSKQCIEIIGPSLSTNTKLARSLFLQDCSIPVSNNGLESFDPLASGQLIIECPSNNSMLCMNNHQKTDDELLKDWDLFDISKGVNSISFDAPPNFCMSDNKNLSNPIPNLYASPPNVKAGVHSKDNVAGASAPLAMTNSPKFKASNLVCSSVNSKTNRSSTLPSWATFQDDGNENSRGSFRSECLWETFD